MIETASAVLTPWSNFYILCGSAAAGLTGLMFVVISLITDGKLRPRSTDGISAFSTPTVVHFGSALLVSAVLCAPWPSLAGPSIVLGLAGVCGVVYVLSVTRRARRLSEYNPDGEDWAFYVVLPSIAYGAIFGAALALRAIPVDALFAFGAGVMLLIFIGIHNAWDIVTYIATGKAADPPSSS